MLTFQFHLEATLEASMSWYLPNVSHFLSRPLVRRLPAFVVEGKSTNVALHVNAVTRCLHGLWQYSLWLSSFSRRTSALEEFWVFYGSKEGTFTQFLLTFQPHLLTLSYSIESGQIGQGWSDSIIISLFTRLPPYASEFIEMCLMITADHGPG